MLTPFFYLKKDLVCFPLTHALQILLSANSSWFDHEPGPMTQVFSDVQHSHGQALGDMNILMYEVIKSLEL